MKIRMILKLHFTLVASFLVLTGSSDKDHSSRNLGKTTRSRILFSDHPKKNNQHRLVTDQGTSTETSDDDETKLVGFKNSEAKEAVYSVLEEVFQGQFQKKLKVFISNKNKTVFESSKGREESAVWVELSGMDTPSVALRV